MQDVENTDMTNAAKSHHKHIGKGVDFRVTSFRPRKTWRFYTNKRERSEITFFCSWWAFKFKRQTDCWACDLLLADFGQLCPEKFVMTRFINYSSITSRSSSAACRWQEIRQAIGSNGHVSICFNGKAIWLRAWWWLQCEPGWRLSIL